MAGSKSVVCVDVLAETEKAWQLVVGEDIKWVPKSVMSWPDDMTVDDEDVDVEIEDWFCVKEGIET